MRELHTERKSNAGVVSQQLQILEALAATGKSGWIDVRKFSKYSIEISGVNGDTIALMGSNKANPQSGDAGVQIGEDITENGFVASTVASAYIQLDVTRVNGTINAILYGVQ